MPLGAFSNRQHPIKLRKATWRGRATPHSGLAHSYSRCRRPRGLSAKIWAVALCTNMMSDTGSEKWEVQLCPPALASLSIPEKTCSCSSQLLMLWFSAVWPTRKRWIGLDPSKSPDRDHHQGAEDLLRSLPTSAFLSFCYSGMQQSSSTTDSTGRGRNVPRATQWICGRVGKRWKISKVSNQADSSHLTRILLANDSRIGCFFFLFSFLFTFFWLFFVLDWFLRAVALLLSPATKFMLPRNSKILRL